uniref:KIB1-4 beta-propeller domain-containing protein n=1 Tax=Oryza punctata TaxID=4537 RepID=A0A0E0KJP4_ORYPU
MLLVEPEDTIISSYEEWARHEYAPVLCLALYLKHGADSDKPTLFSISEKKAINGGDIPELTNTNCWVTPQGWILVRDIASATTFLQNPHDSDDKIQLLHLPQDFYFNGDFESIGVLEFSPVPAFSSITITDPIVGGLGVMGMANLYLVRVGSLAAPNLVEFLDEPYMVCQMYDSDMEAIYRVTVYRMDFSKQQWCIAEDIGGRAFLVASCYFGASRSADECGLEKGCVYAIFARDKYFEMCR